MEIPQISSMVDNINRAMPDRIYQNTPKPENKEILEISDSAREYAIYMQNLEKLPEVREDVVQRIREQIQSTIRWPPVIVLDGVAILVGQKTSIMA